MRSFSPVFFLLGATVLVTHFAHAFDLTIINQYNVPDRSLRLISADPHEGQELDVSPSEVTLTFPVGVRSDKSYIRVTDMYGTQVNDGTVQVRDVTMSTALPELPPGSYRVKWKARCQCDDQDDISDSYKFTVR